MKIQKIIKKSMAIKVILIAIVFIPVIASAGTSVSLSGNAVRNVGETFTVSISLNPQEKIYTAKVEINFPASNLEVVGFNFGPNAMPLSQSGYDLVDNNKGIIIKTAGYSGGIDNAQNFGSITFRAKKAGEGVISVSSNSQIYDENNENVLGSKGSLSFTIKNLIEAKAETKVETKTSAPVNTIAVSTTKSQNTKPTSTVSSTSSQNTNYSATNTLAAVSNASSVSYAYIISVIIAFVLGFGIGRITK